MFYCYSEAFLSHTSTRAVTGFPTVLLVDNNEFEEGTNGLRPLTVRCLPLAVLFIGVAAAFSPCWINRRKGGCGRVAP